MSRPRLLLTVAAVALTLLVSSRWGVHAQDGDPDGKSGDREREGRNVGRARIPVEEAMQKPFAMNFAAETTLEAVAKSLQKGLDAPVVLDLAAVKRRGLTPESTVKLELQGVRLKTGLKLLLDQVGMTYHVVPGDNLLVLTDAEGAEDPSSRVLAELKHLRHDVNDLLDAVGGLQQGLMPVEEMGPAFRKPTIIEDVPPGKEGDKGKDDDKQAPSRPGE